MLKTFRNLLKFNYNSIQLSSRLLSDSQFSKMEEEKPKMESIQEGKAQIYFASSSPDDVFYNPGNNYIKSYLLLINYWLSILLVTSCLI